MIGSLFSSWGSGLVSAWNPCGWGCKAGNCSTMDSSNKATCFYKDWGFRRPFNSLAKHYILCFKRRLWKNQISGWEKGAYFLVCGLLPVLCEWNRRRGYPRFEEWSWLFFNNLWQSIGSFVAMYSAASFSCYNFKLQPGPSTMNLLLPFHLLLLPWHALFANMHKMDLSWWYLLALYKCFIIL